MILEYPVYYMSDQLLQSQNTKLPHISAIRLPNDQNINIFIYICIKTIKNYRRYSIKTNRT